MGMKTITQDQHDKVLATIHGQIKACDPTSISSMLTEVRIQAFDESEIDNYHMELIFDDCLNELIRAGKIALEVDFSYKQNELSEVHFRQA